MLAPEKPCIRRLLRHERVRRVRPRQRRVNLDRRAQVSLCFGKPPRALKKPSELAMGVRQLLPVERLVRVVVRGALERGERIVQDLLDLCGL